MLISAYVVMILWAMLLIIPVIWAYARYFAIVPAFAVESLSASEAIRRSKQLAKKNNGRAIALGLVPALVAGIIMVIVQQGLLGAGVAFLTTRVIGSIMTIVLYPFSMVPAIFLYYDLRTRREGLDLDFGTLPHPTPTAAA
jgi:membrane-anchored glycerophosphoryl diester phosphodiesterase (GDPDase)